MRRPRAIKVESFGVLEMESHSVLQRAVEIDRVSRRVTNHFVTGEHVAVCLFGVPVERVAHARPGPDGHGVIVDEDVDAGEHGAHRIDEVRRAEITDRSAASGP
jgi:hypothetical protein